MQEFVTHFIANYGYLAVGFLILIENIFPPIPSEVVLVFGGVMCGTAGLNPWVTILSATVGSVVGAALLYLLGRTINNDRLTYLLSGKVGRVLHFKPEYIQKADRFFKKYGKSAVLFGRCVPLIRSIISIPAGMSKMNLSAFFMLTTLGSFVWNIILVWIGVLSHDAWQKSLEYFSIITKVGALLIFAVAIVIFILHKYKKSKKINKD